MTIVDNDLKAVNDEICRRFADSDFSPRSVISRDFLALLRDFSERLMLKAYAEGADIENTPSNLQAAMNYVKTRGELKVIYRFYVFLQTANLYYVLEEENSERFMLKFCEYLFLIRKLVREKFGGEVLENLERFPLNVDETRRDLSEKIAEKLRLHEIRSADGGEIYYIEKVTPFFAEHEVYYEVIFSPAADNAGVADHVTAFTKIKLTDCYAARLSLLSDSIELFGKTTSITVIAGWEVAIRNCEYENFMKCVTGRECKVSAVEQERISEFLTSTGFYLSELSDFPDYAFQSVEQVCTGDIRGAVFFDALRVCRSVVREHRRGENLIRYLLYQMNNKVIKKQYKSGANAKLSGMCFQNGCIPFDNMPFACSLIGHVPKLCDLLECIPVRHREHELLARAVRVKADKKGRLFTNVKELAMFGDIPNAVKRYNEKLWFGHLERSRLVIDDGRIFINGCMDNVGAVVSKLQELSSSGVRGYSKAVDDWLAETEFGIDSEEKAAALRGLFEHSKAAFVCGAAGTGKSSFVNLAAHFFADKRKLLLAQTNAAADALKQRVTAPNCIYSTISNYLRKRTRFDYDLIVIDDCGTVDNEDMRSILYKENYRLLLLVGDASQPAPIRFGNWFDVARSFVSASSVFEFTTFYRTANDDLRSLWKSVREMDNVALGSAVPQKYLVASEFPNFEPEEDDEIILCLDRGGLYGVNNVNRFLQESVSGAAVKWGARQYKVGDPILFNECERFSTVIHSNMRGKIVGIDVFNDEPNSYIRFDIELYKVIDCIDAFGCDLEILDDSEYGKTLVRFKVFKPKSDDDDGVYTTVPFQHAYAVPILKALGSEYRSVKLVISDEIGEPIPYDIFYTAITRAREKLKIYLAPGAENRRISNVRSANVSEDIALLNKYIE